MRAYTFVAVLLLGCGATNGGLRFDTTPAKPAPEIVTARTSSPEVGVIVLISDAMANLQLDHAQNDQLVQLVSSIKERHQRVEEMRKVLSLDMAASVAAGVIDGTTLDLDAKKLGSVRAEVAPADGKALEDLHRILTPAQRKQFATALAARAETLPIDDASTRYGNWRSDLEITVIQNEKIEPKLDGETTISPSAKAEREAWQRRLRDTAAAFDKEAFSASSYVDPDVEKTTVERVRRVTTFLKLIVPVLTQKQLAAAAENLRAEAGAKD
jgi:Spy/CpxP family protein refolding chaperone